jgi:hypothetical protein
MQLPLPLRVKKPVNLDSRPLITRLKHKLKKKARRLGLIGLLVTTQLTSGCASLPTKQPQERGSAALAVPQYSDAEFYAVIQDKKTCGPEAKQFISDYTVLLTQAMP